MAKIPKYKKDPKYALKYALRKGILTDEHEKVFLKDVECAIEYAVRVKQARLISEVENSIYNFYCTNSKNFKSSEVEKKPHNIIAIHHQKRRLDPFFNYVKLVKTIPKEHEENFLKNIEPQNIIRYVSCTEKRLSKKYEDYLLKISIERNKFSYLVEYSYAIGCKLPEEMHNCLLCQYIKNKENLVLVSYFTNLKNIKNQFLKITQFLDKNLTIKEVIEQM